MAGKRLKWGSIAPVASQKAARFPGRRARHAGALYNDRLDAAAAQEVRDRGTDYAGAADYHSHRRASSRSR
jgi:hypothetical protein